VLRFDPVTKNIALIGSLGSGFVSSGDLAYSAQHGFYASVRDGSGTVFLAKLDPINYRAQRVGSQALPDNTWGLSFVGDRLYGLTSDPLGTGHVIEINITTGVATVVRNLSFNAGGSSFRAGSRSR
jgi:hypothetical protein